MIVTQGNIHSILTSLSLKSALALDTETTGLRPYHGDRAFSLILADDQEAFYFDFNTDGWKPDLVQLREFFKGPRVWFLANAKFDMAMLAMFGVTLQGVIHDLQAIERILDSTLFGQVFSLDAIAARYGEMKSKALDEYIKKHKLLTKMDVPGKDKQVERWHAEKVPLDVIQPYAEKDGVITFRIGAKQLKRIAETRQEGIPDIDGLVTNERVLIKTVYEMERVGVKIDRAFCEEAAKFEGYRKLKLEEEFKALAGAPYVNSAKALTPLFQKEQMVKCINPKTKKPTANNSFSSDVLETFSSPLAKIILGIRDAKSKSDYYHGFLYQADYQDVIHASFNQHQARTGRFSSSEPNLQNMTKPDEEQELQDVMAHFTVRRAIVPRPGYFFAMFDYNQVEYRLMLEYAKAKGLIDKVNAGLDVHQATSVLAGVTRQQAKTTNFLTIYGGGLAILAKKLGLTLDEAKRVQDAIFAASPEIRDFIAECTQRAKTRGFIFNWLGRRQYFPDPTLAYKAANGLIQGGCADIMKVGMNRVHNYLLPFQSRIVLTVHDELVIETHESEADILPNIQSIMETVYPHKLLPLTVGVDHSWKSLADKVKGYPPGVKLAGRTLIADKPKKPSLVLAP